MNFLLLITLISLPFFAFPASASFPHFFPNISSIPPSLIPNTSFGAWEGFKKLAGCRAGDNVTGLAKLKDYFRYFGYINNSTANFTNSFDDFLQEALRTYQRNFNLNQTGELDAPTVTQILLPRCGVADIVNGSTTMNSGRAPSASSIHAHTVAHYSFFPGSPRWPARQTELTYGFAPENELPDNVKLVFSHAFERWSEVTPLTFTETSSYYNADIRIGFFSGDHGDGESFDGALGTLAHAFSPPSGRFHLDAAENWVFDEAIYNNPSSSAVDLESVAVHEIGHLLGLGHSSVEESIMYPTIRSGSRKVELANDDVQGIQVLYGSNPNYNGPTSSPTLQERDYSGAFMVGPTWRPTFLLTVVLLLFVL